MRGASGQALTAALDRIEPMLSRPDSGRLGEELFEVASLLDGSVGLRRAMTDPSREGQAKVDLVERLLGSQVTGTTVDVVSGLVRDRWSSSADLAQACEQLGVLAVLGAAEQAGTLEQVESDLFRFGRIIDSDPGLRAALSDRRAPVAVKAELVDRLLEGKVTVHTKVLARRGLSQPRGRRIEAVVEQLGQAVAARRDRTVARVTTAVPLEEAQRERLAAALGRIYGRVVHLDVDVDPEVLGGMHIQVADEVIDASVLARMAAARRQLTG